MLCALKRDVACPTHYLTVVDRHVCICFVGELWHFVQQRFKMSSGGTGNRASGAFCPQHLRGMATGASPMDAEEQRQSGAVAAAAESTSASATSFTLAAGYRGSVAAVSAELSGDAPADDFVVVAEGVGAGGDEGVAGEGAAAAATGDEALTRSGRVPCQPHVTEAAEAVNTGAAPAGRVKLNVWHVPMQAWRVTEMWVKPDATWNQVKYAVQHQERRRGPYWAAPRQTMHRVVGRDDGLWYHWSDRIMDPPATSATRGREDGRTNTTWRVGHQFAHGNAAGMFFADDPVILEDTSAVKSVVMVPNLDFECP